MTCRGHMYGLVEPESEASGWNVSSEGGGLWAIWSLLCPKPLKYRCVRGAWSIFAEWVSIDPSTNAVHLRTLGRIHSLLFFFFFFSVCVRTHWPWVMDSPT